MHTPQTDKQRACWGTGPTSEPPRGCAVSSVSKYKIPNRLNVVMESSTHRYTIGRACNARSIGVVHLNRRLRPHLTVLASGSTRQIRRVLIVPSRLSPRGDRGARLHVGPANTRATPPARRRSRQSDRRRRRDSCTHIPAWAVLSLSMFIHVRSRRRGQAAVAVVPACRGRGG